MFAELAVILIMLIAVAFMYLKGTIIKAFVLLINSLLAATVALAYFEVLARLIIGYELIPQWAYGASLILIFAIVLTILNIIAGKFVMFDLYLGDFADRIVRCLLAALAGFAISGIILTAVAMMPVGIKWPYERFNSTPSSAEPEKTLILNADGFITGFCSWISQGSMGGAKSMAVFHPDLLEEIYLNRIGVDDQTSALAKYPVTVESAQVAPTQLVSLYGSQPISGDAQTKAVVIKAGTQDQFSMAQLRLICKDSDSADNLKGSGYVVWPAGYVVRDNVVDVKNLPDKVPAGQFNFVFNIPSGTVPVMLQYKQNTVAAVGKLINSQTPAPVQPQ